MTGHHCEVVYYHIPMRRIQASLLVLPFLIWSATLAGQAMNTLTAQEKAQGWQLLFDGATLKGWHSTVPARGAGGGRGGRGRAGAPPPSRRHHQRPCNRVRSRPWELRRSLASLRSAAAHWRLAIPIGKSWMAR